MEIFIWVGKILISGLWNILLSCIKRKLVKMLGKIIELCRNFGVR